MSRPANLKSPMAPRLHGSRLPTRVATSILIAGTLALAGCAGHSKSHFTVGSVPSTYKTKHPIIIDEQEQTLDIPVASDSYALPLASVSAVEGLAYNYRRSASGAVTIMMPSGSANARAARKMGDKIASVLGKSGVPHHRIRMVTYDASQHGATAPVRLSYNAIKASVEKCGQWTDDLASSQEGNKNYNNFGCASQSNLATMIANPADLLGPRGMSEIDAARRGVGIEDWRSNGSVLQGPPDTVYTR